MRSLLCGLVLGLSGCTTFEYGEFPLLEQWPPAAVGEGGAVRVELEGLPKKFVAGWQRGAVQVFEGSGRFSRVTAGSEGAVDRRVRLVFEHTRSNLWVTRIWMGVCAMTAATIPARTAQQFDVQAIVYDADGRQLGVIERSVEGVTWVGWPCLFVLPFAGGGLGTLVEDTMRSITVEAVQAGWL